jgi:DNA-binding transcriptional MerR regulator
MPDDPYTLADLARLGDVTPRTIRYYLHRGLLPSPEPAGPATRYGEGHLRRLRLIRRLQRDHLPLAEIRARLERMDDAAVESAIAATGDAAPAPAMSTDETLAFVRNLMSRAGVSPRFYDVPPAQPSATFEPAIPDGFPVRDRPAPVPGAPDPAAPPPGVPAAPSVPIAPRIAVPALSIPVPSAPRQGGERSTWERLAITPDVEIHVRRPLDRHANKRVEQLARIARELFEDEA